MIGWIRRYLILRRIRRQLDAKTVEWLRQSESELRLVCAVEGHNYQPVSGTDLVCMTCGKKKEEQG